MDLREAKFTTEPTAARRHPWERARCEVVIDLLQRHLGLGIQAARTALDMGCGDAWLVDRIAQRLPQHRYLGVDTALVEPQLSEQQQQYQGRVDLYTTLDQAAAKLADTPVDVVFLLDVIEHIEDEVAFLRWMQTFPQITAQTAFVITVPAFQGLFCAHDEFLLHYRRYTRRSLQQALQNAGLRSRHDGYFFSSLIPPRVLQVALEKTGLRRPDPNGVGQWQGSEAATRAITRILQTDYRLGQSLRKAGLHLPGLSTFSIAYPQKA